MEHPIVYILTSVTVFTGIILLLTIGLMAASRKLVPSGAVAIDINDSSKVLKISAGSSLLSSLASEKIFLPSACGGGGPEVDETVERTSDQRKAVRLAPRGVARTLDVVA